MATRAEETATRRTVLHKLINALDGSEIMPEEENTYVVLYQKIICDGDGKLTMYYFVQEDV